MKNMPIYVIVGLILAIFIVIIVGATNKPKEQQIEHGDIIVYRNFSTIISRIIIENHTYLFVQGDSNAIIHAESCPCKSINKGE